MLKACFFLLLTSLILYGVAFYNNWVECKDFAFQFGYSDISMASQLYNSLQVLVLYSSRFLYNAIFHPETLTLFNVRILTEEVSKEVSRELRSMQTIEEMHVEEKREERRLMKKEQSRKVIPKDNK